MELEEISKNIETIVLILLFIVVSVLKMVEIYLKKTKKIDTEQLDLLSEELTNLKTIITNSETQSLSLINVSSALDTTETPANKQPN